MAKQAQFLPVNDIEDVYEVGEIQPPEPKTDAEKKTDAIADALNDDGSAFINVSRQRNGGNSPMEFVGRYPADKFDFGQLQAVLQSNYGGGDYRCILYANGRVRANKLITIATRENNGPEITATGEMGQFMNGVMNVMREMQQQMLALAQENKTGGTSRMDMMNEMILMKNLFSSDTQPQGNIITQMKDLMGLQSEIQGMLPAPSDSEDKGFGDLVEKFTPLMTAAMNSQPNPQVVPEMQPTPEQQRAQQMKAMLSMGIQQLLRAASKNADHGQYAELVLDQVPESVIRQVVIAPDAIDKLCSINPKVREFSPWFLLLGEHIKAQLGEPSTVSPLYQEADIDLTPETGGDSVAGKPVVNEPLKDDPSTDVHTP